MFEGKSILITGGTGSFGQAFVQHLLANYHPGKVIVYSRDELKQHEMAKKFDGPEMRYFIGDVRDVDRLTLAFGDVDYVVHAAAMKQVPACEYNVLEAVRTNILGAQNVLLAALQNEVERVVALSSDKAVAPINLYGATKMVAERLFVHGNVYVGNRGYPQFSVVRYGNVVGSRGSVIPLFLEQAKTGRLTITDARMTRFWMTLERACELVVDALENAYPGEIVIPADLSAMSIVQLAAIIAPQAKLMFSCIRPGEKLHESLISPHEIPRTYRRGDTYVVIPESTQLGQYSGMAQVPSDFEYTSLTAPPLSIETTVEMIGDLPEAREWKGPHTW